LNKGQSFSIDFMAATAIFLILIAFIMVYWFYTNAQVYETQGIENMIDKVQMVSEVLFSEGYPEYWSPSDFVTLGFQNDNRFNQTKLDYLITIGYDNSKRLMGVGVDDYYIRLFDQSDNTKFTFGVFPNGEKNLIRIKRVGILNGEIVFAEIFVWN
jgi:hypothetical protein